MRIIYILLLLSGCAVEHTGRIETFNASGEATGTYTATLDRPMMIEVTAPNGVTVKADSRPLGESSFGSLVNSLIEIATIKMVVDD